MLTESWVVRSDAIPNARRWKAELAIFFDGVVSMENSFAARRTRIKSGIKKKKSTHKTYIRDTN